MSQPLLLYIYSYILTVLAAKLKHFKENFDILRLSLDRSEKMVYNIIVNSIKSYFPDD